jgi:hypothetical protein
MKNNKSEDQEEIEFISLKELMLQDNDKIREIKSLYEKEEEYSDYLEPIEFCIANLGMDNHKLKDKDIVRALRNVRDNLDKDLDFFKSDLEKEVMFALSESLQTYERITKYEVMLVVKHILWAIDNRSWLDDSRAYLTWIANFFDLLEG